MKAVARRQAEGADLEVFVEHCDMPALQPVLGRCIICDPGIARPDVPALSDAFLLIDGAGACVVMPAGHEFAGL